MGESRRYKEGWEGGGDESRTNTHQTPIAGQPFAFLVLSYSRLTAILQEQHMTPEVATGVVFAQNGTHFFFWGVLIYTRR